MTATRELLMKNFAAPPMHSDKPGAVTIVSENREDVLARMPAPDPLLGSLLRRALEQETCVYCPCPQLIVKFLEELVRLFEDPSKIGIVTEDGLMVAAEAGAETPASQGYLRCNLPKCLKKVWTLSALATAPLSQLSCVVFYGIEDILALEARIEATGALLHGVMFKTAVTACPSAFRAYLLRSRAKYFSCVLSEFTVQHSYGGFLRAATVVGYAPFGSRPADAEMEQKVLAVPIRAQLVNELVSMLKRNVFDSGPFENLLGFQYISEKLVRLREIVAASGGQPLVIYVSGKKDRGILATIVQRWVAALEPAVSVCAARVPSSAHTISIVDSIPAQTLGSACLVLFDPLPALAQPSVFVLADRREQELLASRAADEQKVFDQLTVPSDASLDNSTNSSVIKTRIDDESCAKDSNEEEHSDGEKIDDAEIECGDAWDREGLPSIPRVVKQKLLGSDRADVYGFAVVTKKSFMVAMEDREELDVLYTKSGINASFVYARCNSGRFAKLVQLHDYLRLPIQVPITRREGPLVGSMTLPISALSTGTLTDYGSFVPAAVQQQNQGFVRMFPREIVVYSFTAEHLLRIQVFKDGIEHCIVMNAVSDDTDDNLYNRCNVYLPLKYHPCLCVCDSPDALRKLLASEQPQEEKFRQIEAMPWARAGVGDVPLFAGAHDIHLSMVTSSNQRTALSDNGPFVALARALCSYGLKILYKEVAHKKAYLSLQSFLNYFLNRDYATYYSVLSLVSRKGRFLVNRLSLDDVTFLQSNDTGALCSALDSCLRERFRFPSLKSLVPKRRQDAFVRTVVLKPTSIEFGFERLKETNRVLRHFDTDKFMRFSMRDNNGIKLTAKAGVSYERLFDYLRQEMLTGISAGPRRYFFLAATTSQLNEHCAWFVTPYEHEGALIGADYIKSWLGNFKDIKNIGKYTVRVAQALSTTKDTCVVNDFVDIPDICRDGHTFTDGIGLISPAFAAAISKQLGYNFVPSAFQIRFAGYKGVVAVHPLMDDSAMLTEWCVRNGVDPSLVLRNPKENKSKIIPGEHTVQLILRASMNKFPSPHRMLEVITYSRSYNFYLNRQIILVLEGLGVPPRVFKELQNKAVLDVLWEMNEDTPGFIRSHVPYFPKEHISTDYTFFRKLVAPLVSRLLESLNTKAKIPVEEGRAAIGVTDELGILEKDEVFLMFLVTKDMNVQKLGRVVMHDGYAVPVGPAFVVKNPCTHPGDVRVVTCVDRRELHYLKECLVFPQTGDRPLFNQCSGSDLDGDIFLLSWNRHLIPRATFRPYNYVNSCALAKQTVLQSDMINFYIRYVKTYQLGYIANASMAAADRHSIFSREALKLADLFNRNIDYIKTGNITTIPEPLIPTAYPDFMERLPSYRSTKINGQLYRRSSVGSISAHCECSDCTTWALDQMNDWQRLILTGAHIVVREEVFAPGEYEDDRSRIAAAQLFREYRADIRGLVNRHGLKTEEALFCSLDEDVHHDVDEVIQKYRSQCRDVNYKELFEQGSRCVESVNSFVWHFDWCRRVRVRASSYVRPKENGETEGYSMQGNCVFNTRLLLVDSTAPQWYGSAGPELLDVPCDLSAYNALVGQLAGNEVELFAEAFNLMFALQKWSFDQVVGVLSLMRAQMAAVTRFEFARHFFLLDDDLLFRVGLFMSLDCSIVYKMNMLQENQRECNSSTAIPKPFKALSLVISGMLDENEDVAFADVSKKGSARLYVPMLKNRGQCSTDYYKDVVHDFIINAVWANERCGLSGKVGYDLLLTPGIFALSRLAKEHVHSSMSIRALENHIQKSDAGPDIHFTNSHRCLDEEQRKQFMQDAKPFSAARKRAVLSFELEGVRYDVEYTGNELTEITRGRRFLARQYMINSSELLPVGCTKNDLTIELLCYDIIYAEGINALDGDEQFLLHEHLFAADGDSCVVSNALSHAGNLRLEINNEYRNADRLFLTHRTVYQSPDIGSAQILRSCGSKLACGASYSWHAGTDIDRALNQLWKVYTEQLAK